MQITGIMQIKYSKQQETSFDSGKTKTNIASISTK